MSKALLKDELSNLDDTIPENSIPGKVINLASINLAQKVSTDFELDDKQSTNPLLERACRVFILEAIWNYTRNTMSNTVAAIFNNIPNAEEFLMEIYNPNKQNIMQYLRATAPGVLENAIKANSAEFTNHQEP